MKKFLTIFASMVAILSITIINFLLMCTHWNTGDKTYTGYIYSVTESLGETEAHLRFSEYAGEDSQPSFCLAKDDIGMARELAGSGKKVKVYIPSGFAIALPWECPIPPQIELIEDK